jgi:hypothetical protein
LGHDPLPVAPLLAVGVKVSTNVQMALLAVSVASVTLPLRVKDAA